MGLGVRWDMAGGHGWAKGGPHSKETRPGTGPTGWGSTPGPWRRLLRETTPSTLGFRFVPDVLAVCLPCPPLPLPTSLRALVEGTLYCMHTPSTDGCGATCVIPVSGSVGGL